MTEIALFEAKNPLSELRRAMAAAGVPFAELDAA